MSPRKPLKRTRALNYSYAKQSLTEAKFSMCRRVWPLVVIFLVVILIVNLLSLVGQGGGGKSWWTDHRRRKLVCFRENYWSSKIRRSPYHATKLQGNMCLIRAARAAWKSNVECVIKCLAWDKVWRLGTVNRRKKHHMSTQETASNMGLSEQVGK